MITHLRPQITYCNSCHTIVTSSHNLCLSHTFAIQSHFCNYSGHNFCTHTTRQFMYIQESPKGGMGDPFSLSCGLRPLITRFIPITFTFHFIPFTLSLSTSTSSTSTRTSYPCCITSKGYQESPNRTVLRQLQPTYPVINSVVRFTPLC